MGSQNANQHHLGTSILYKAMSSGAGVSQSTESLPSRDRNTAAEALSREEVARDSKDELQFHHIRALLRPASPSSTLEPPSPPCSSKGSSVERGIGDAPVSLDDAASRRTTDPAGWEPLSSTSLASMSSSQTGALANSWQDVQPCMALLADARCHLEHTSSSLKTSQIFPQSTISIADSQQGPENSDLQEAGERSSGRRDRWGSRRTLTDLPTRVAELTLLPRSSTAPRPKHHSDASPSEDAGYCSSSDDCEEVTRRLTAAFPGLPHRRGSYERYNRWSPAKASASEMPRLLSPAPHSPTHAGSLAALTPEEAQVLQDRRRLRNNHHLTTGDAAVELFLRLKHAKQSFDFAKRQATSFSSLRCANMDLWQALDMLDELREYEAPLMQQGVAPGSPQLEPSMSLKEHAMQTAELCRLAHPDKDWLHLVGLIHGLGKLLAHETFGSQPQWAVCGESFPLGCSFDKGLEGSQFFSANPDRRRRIFSTPTGIYSPGCGLQHVCMTWSAAEYMYLMLLLNSTALPKEALFIIRNQKFFSLTRRAACTYHALLSNSDRALLPLLSSFQQLAAFKRVELAPGAALSPEAQRTYYTGLIQKYIGCTNLAW